MEASTAWFIASILVGISVFAGGIFFEKHADEVASAHKHSKKNPKCFWCRWAEGGPLVGWFAFLAGIALPILTYQLV